MFGALKTDREKGDEKVNLVQRLDIVKKRKKTTKPWGEVVTKGVSETLDEIDELWEQWWLTSYPILMLNLILFCYFSFLSITSSVFGKTYFKPLKIRANLILSLPKIDMRNMIIVWRKAGHESVRGPCVIDPEAMELKTDRL